MALDVEQLRFSRRGLYVWIATAKNDPRKKGRELYMPRLPMPELCAVVAIERWLATVGAFGPIFRTLDLRGTLTANWLDFGDVPRIIRRRGKAASLSGDFTGHSLRRGLIMNAALKIPLSFPQIYGKFIEDTFSLYGRSLLRYAAVLLLLSCTPVVLQRPAVAKTPCVPFIRPIPICTSLQKPSPQSPCGIPGRMSDHTGLQQVDPKSIPDAKDTDLDRNPGPNPEPRSSSRASKDSTPAPSFC